MKLRTIRIELQSIIINARLVQLRGSKSSALLAKKIERKANYLLNMFNRLENRLEGEKVSNSGWRYWLRTWCEFSYDFIPAWAMLGGLGFMFWVNWILGVMTFLLVAGMMGKWLDVNGAFKKSPLRKKVK